MFILPKRDLPAEKINDFFKRYWGSSEMVITSGVYDCHLLDGVSVIDTKGTIMGLITYTINGDECEIISLDSVQEGKGFGTLLVQEVENIARHDKCKLVKLITTNDNLNALKFYQKRGFILSNLYINAVDKARKYKPTIPHIGYEGIPIRDEIELQKIL
ncbi:GNAT family N-acetyltransferase [Bacillus sp. AK128]